MSKYEPLAQFLKELPDDVWDAQFDEVAKVLGFSLPESAHKYPAWWANQDPGHSQTAGWRDAGWDTSKVDLASKRVRFVRQRRRAKATQKDQRTGLIDQAKDITGITDEHALIEAALLALIQREAGRRLIALGGTMPDAWAPPRERPVV